MRAAAERLLPAGDGWAVRVRCSDRSHGDFRMGETSSFAVGEIGSFGVSETRFPGSKTGQISDFGVGEASGFGVDETRFPDDKTGQTHRVEIARNNVLEPRRQAFMAGRWTWLRQTHGADVVVVAKPGDGAGAFADAAVTAVPHAVLAVQTADCAPVVVAGCQAVGIAHAGWRGIASGVISAMVNAVRAIGTRVSAGLAGSPPHGLCAVIGPVIRPSHYEFGSADLAAVAAAVGSDNIRGVTDWGTPALDLAAAVKDALRSADVKVLDDLGLNTADERFFSHRVRREQARQVTVARLETVA